MQHGVLNVCNGRCHLCAELKRPFYKGSVPPRSRSQRELGDLDSNHKLKFLLYATISVLCSLFYVLSRGLARHTVAQRFVHFAAAPQLVQQD